MIKLRLSKSFRRRHERRMLPLRLLSEVFSCQETEKPKETKKNKPLHSPKRLGGLKPPLEQAQGDSKLHNPSGWETLTSTRLTQGGPKSGRRGGNSLLPATQAQKFSPSFRRRPTRERESVTRYPSFICCLCLNVKSGSVLSL
jgi:hypothetical protein